MDKNRGPESPNEKDMRLPAAIARAEAEVKRVKEWIASRQPELENSYRSERRTGSAHKDGGDKKTAGPGNPSGPPTGTIVEVRLESLEVLKRISEQTRESTITTRRYLLLAIAGMIVAIIGLLVAIIFGVVSANKNAERVDRTIKQTKLIINSPLEGAKVGTGQRVLGRTPFTQLNHYLAVVLVRTGDLYLLQVPVHVNADGTFSGDARFNDTPVTEDDELKLQVLVTRAELPAGKLDRAQLPDEAVFSDSVTIKWVKSLAGQLVIINPTDGAEVDFTNKIVGRTPFPELTHYIVVTSVRVGTAFVQDRPATVNRDDGSYSAAARFGSARVGRGEQFIVRVLATKSKLPAGPLVSTPPDAVTSNVVTVRRRK